MDMMILVIDVIRGIQTQTAECLVIGSITCENAVIVLNKIDLIEESQRAERVAKTKQNIRKAIAKTKFRDAPIIAISASVGGAGKSVGETVANTKSGSSATGAGGAGAGAGSGASSVSAEKHSQADDAGTGTANAFPEVPTLGISELVEAVSKATVVPKRVISDKTPMLYMVDHCFSVRGQGTVLTGTVLQGVDMRILCTSGFSVSWFSFFFFFLSCSFIWFRKAVTPTQQCFDMAVLPSGPCVQAHLPSANPLRFRRSESRRRSKRSKCSAQTSRKLSRVTALACAWQDSTPSCSSGPLFALQAVSTWSPRPLPSSSASGTNTNSFAWAY